MWGFVLHPTLRKNTTRLVRCCKSSKFWLQLKCRRNDKAMRNNCRSLQSSAGFRKCELNLIVRLKNKTAKPVWLCHRRVEGRPTWFAWEAIRHFSAQVPFFLFWPSPRPQRRQSGKWPLPCARLLHLQDHMNHPKHFPGHSQPCHIISNFS